MQQREEVLQGLIERARQAGCTPRKVEEVGCRDELVLEPHVMAPRAPETRGVPAVLDLPLLGRQQNAPNQRRLTARSRQRLAVLGHDAEAEDPAGVLAAAGEGPASADPPAAVRRLCRAGGLDRPRGDDVRAVTIDPFVCLRWHEGQKEAGDTADHGVPSDRAVDSAEGADDLQAPRQVELHAADAARREHAEDAD